MEAQVSLDCGASFHAVNILYKEGSSVVTVAPFSQDHVAPNQPAKNQTRQWAAWTRQEEESFFTALRQVGKNFEKITYCVQSKNKDQVRHYYYRLARRMNKLLGPEICLDAKNSKDTSAAMLRWSYTRVDVMSWVLWLKSAKQANVTWWSLLEKCSCKASKLHLKPRRFKMFLDTLEHQLLKDRRKNKRKQHAQGENCPTTASATVFNQGTATITAAYKRWENAAIAAVSLVADAAEHLKRTSLDEVVEHVHGTMGEKGMGPVGKVVPSSPTSIQNLFGENSTQTFKLKLQLFPIDETTRRALEMDNHNPHLELTLSTRKKISSVVEHLNRKWGRSSIACGELVLLPYCVQWGNLVSCQRWTQDSVLSAADICAQIGSPSIFRLRYCWLSSAGHELMTCQAPLALPSILNEHGTNMNDAQHQHADSVPDFTPPSEQVSGNLIDSCRDQVVSAGKNTELASSTYMQKDMIECFGTGLDKNILDSSNNPPAVSLQRETCSLAIMRQVEEKDEMRLQTGTALTPGEWADSLTNISMGDLLSEASDIMDTSCVSPSLQGSSQCLQQVPFSCDSFDAAIAALIYKHQDKTGFQSTLESRAPSSICDAEETCDAFSFQKNTVSLDKVLGASTNDFPESCEQSATTCLIASGSVVEEFHEREEPMDDDPNHGDPMNEFQPVPTTEEDSAKYLTGLCYLTCSLDFLLKILSEQ